MEDGLWFSPGSIRFTREQMRWLLYYLPILKQGQWPSEPDGGDVLIRTHKQSKRAYWELSCTIAAEVEVRLEMTEDDGFICKDRYCHEEDERTLSRKYHLPIEKIEMRIRRALRYMSGWQRKKITYQEFISHRREKPTLASKAQPGAPNTRLEPHPGEPIPIKCLKPMGMESEGNRVKLMLAAANSPLKNQR